MLKISACVALCLFGFGCEEKAAEEPKPAEKAIEVSEVKTEPEVKPVASAPAEPSEEQKAQAEVEANPLTKCCRALGQRGFMQRSPDYIAASKVCGESMTKNETVAQAMSGIKKALGKETLPAECK